MAKNKRLPRRFPPQPVRLKNDDFEPIGPQLPTSKPKLRALLRKFQEADLKFLRAQFVATRDPYFAWMAYRIVSNHADIPLWVHDYFRIVATNLIFLKEHDLPRKTHIDSAIADAVGFGRFGIRSLNGPPRKPSIDGARNPFREPHSKSFHLACAVYKRSLDRDIAGSANDKKTYAYEQAAADFSELLRGDARESEEEYRTYLSSVGGDRSLVPSSIVEDMERRRKSAAKGVSAATAARAWALYEGHFPKKKTILRKRVTS